MIVIKHPKFVAHLTAADKENARSNVRYITENKPNGFLRVTHGITTCGASTSDALSGQLTSRSFLNGTLVFFYQIYQFMIAAKC